jgi:chromosomal replication initiation ATPase DnaA
MTYYCYPGVIDSKYIPAQMTAEIRLQYAKQIIETVARFYGVELENLYSKKRGHDLTTACQMSCYLIGLKIPALNLVQVAKLFGMRYICRSGYNYDHSAIIYNRNKIEDFIKVNDYIKDDIDKLRTMV